MFRQPIKSQSSTVGWLYGIGLLLLLQQIFVTLISERFIYEVDIAHTPVFAYVLSQVAAGIVFLFLLRVIPRLTVSTGLIPLTLLIGLLLRLLLFDSQPIMEIDFYRYLWDGAVTANGYNPWLLAPESISQAGSEELQRLAADAGSIFERINYAELRTIYPPLTQLVFAAAYLLDDWSLNAWRVLILLFDIASLAIILQILKQLERSALWSLLYWWNPLLIHESYNALHMDILLLPCLLMAVLWLIRKHYIAATAMLTLAAGFKLWPLLLIPFCIRPLLSKPRELVMAITTMLVIGLIVIAPLFYFALGENSGLLSYSQSWLRNSALFPFLDSVLSSMALNSRLLIALCLGGFALFLNRQPLENADEILAAICWLVATLFLLSPTQFPWYTIWFAPLLCFYPQPALLLLVALMPIYYLRFYFVAVGNTEFFDNFVIWFQYLPVYGLLLLAYIRRHSFPLVTSSHV